MADSPKETVTYWAVSIFSSRTFWLNVIAAIIALDSATEITSFVFPAKFLPGGMAFIAGLNIFLRMYTVRPVALIPIGTTQPVEVPKLDPPSPPIVSD